MTSNERDLSEPIKKALNINNNDYKIVGNEGGGDCFFASLRDAFQDKKKYENITIPILRERLANNVSQEEYDDQKSVAEAIGIEGETKDIIESKNLEDFKQKIVSKEFWANHWAINKIEKLYNIKFIIIKEPENGNIFQCTDQNLNNNPVYILLYFSGRDEGAHYELIKYKVKSYFNSLDEISEIKDKYINTCGTPEQKQALKQATEGPVLAPAPKLKSKSVPHPPHPHPRITHLRPSTPTHAHPLPVPVVDKEKEAKYKDAKEKEAAAKQAKDAKEKEAKEKEAKEKEGKEATAKQAKDAKEKETKEKEGKEKEAKEAAAKKAKEEAAKKAKEAKEEATKEAKEAAAKQAKEEAAKKAKEKEAKEKEAKSLAKVLQPDVPVDTKPQISSEDNIPSKDDMEKLQKKKEQAKELINIAKKAKEMAEKNNNLSEEAVENLQKAKQDLQDAKSTYTFIDKELSKKNGIYLMNNKNIQKDEEIKDEEIKDEEIKKMQEKEEQIEQLEEKEESNNDFLVINLSIIGIIVFGAFQFLKN